MKVLDLYCGAGGAAMGYAKAGFEVLGVDIDPQPRYPFPFYQGDAITFLKRYSDEFDVIHASPPCQAYSTGVTSINSKWVPTKGKLEPKLIHETRQWIPEGIPYIIENVMGAKNELLYPILLCGTMFSLPIPRHRLFEVNFSTQVPEHPKCKGVAKRYALENNIEYRDMRVTGKGRHAGTSERWSKFLGIDWHMTQHELSESIPPSYTEYIGKQLIKMI